jgi:type 1 glutamine amidotransferase
MMRFRTLLLLAALLAVSTFATAEDKKQRLLLVTHSGGFIHDSVGVAEDLLKELGPKKGYDVTCWRFTGDPEAKVKVKGKDGEKEVSALEKYSTEFRARTGKAVEKENCGRINAKTLKDFDVVLFFTTGSGPKKGNIGPMTADELKDFTAWVKAGGAFAGTHCASDTMYDSSYGELIGGYFKTHPPGLQDIVLKVEDAKHPAAVGLTDGLKYKDEIYVFTDVPYSREKLHIILSAQEFYPKDGKQKDLRADKDYAISWCREEGKGKVFYTALGHDKKVWKDEKFQAHLFGGLDWATNQAKGDASPTIKK